MAQKFWYIKDSSICCLFQFIFITKTSPFTPWRVKSQSIPLYVKRFVKEYIKANIKVPRYLPFVGETTGGQWIPFTQGQ